MSSINPMDDNGQNQRIEIDLLLDAIYLKYGYDFRNYSKASVRRRVRHHLKKSGLGSVSEMQHHVLYDRNFFEKLLLDLTINVTEMFRDPAFFKTLRETVLARLKGQSFIKVWHAGCATGEEVYSMAVLLREEGYYKNFRIYATDTNEEVLEAARKGIFPLARMKDYTRNYIKSGGRGAFASYYTARYDHALIHHDLRKNIVFSHHNLVTDSVFGEMDIILCRNVLIYFNQTLQDRVLQLFRDSLAEGGFLCLGSKETIRFSSVSDDFQHVDTAQKIYRKRDGREQNS